MWTTHKIGCSHVPYLKSVPQPTMRKLVKAMAVQRTSRIAAYQGSQGKYKPLVVAYFRDSNGDHVIQMLLAVGIDVVVFGYTPNIITESSLPGRLIPLHDTSYFVQFMGIADGVVGSAGCMLQAECVYAQIPMLALHREDDTEQALNVYMSTQLRYNDGRQLIYGFSFEELAAASRSNARPNDLNEFLKDIRQSDVSASFYESKGKEIADESSNFVLENELLDGFEELSTPILRIIEKERDRSTKC
jgi:Glycosyl transferase family 1